jgi:hypothetical protein
MASNSLTALTDDALLQRLGELLRASRRVESDLVAHIAEVDRRRLYAREAAPSMFAYCTEVLHLSEAEAYLRIAVARASREYPVLLSLLADGSLHLTGIALLAPHLTAENREALLERARHRTKRQIEELTADIAPRSDAPGLIRRLPERGRQAESRLDPASSAALGPQRVHSTEGVERPQPEAHVLSPVGAQPVPSDLRLDGVRSQAPQLSPAGVEGDCVRPLEYGGSQARERAAFESLGKGRYRVQFTASASLRDKLERLRQLLRHEVPDGDLATIIDRLVGEKLERIEARRFGKTSRPRSQSASKRQPPAPSPTNRGGFSAAGSPSRYIPAAVRRVVHERAGSQCGFVDASGRRCSERTRLEFHHRHPFGMGGGHSPTNIGLLCRTHNTYLAIRDYGQDAMARHAARRRRATGANGRGVT